MIRDILTLLASFLPKYDKIVFKPYPDWEDMTLAIMETLQHQNKKMILITTQKSSEIFFENYPFNLKFVRRKSIMGLYHLMTAKIIFCTHGIFYQKAPRKTTIVNLWHGFGFKAVGTYIGYEGHSSTVVIGSSEYSKQFFSKEMNVPLDKVIPLGFSRNDRLINAFANKITIKEKLGFSKYQHIIIWMPTYRSTVEGDSRSDGIQYDNPFNLEQFNIKHFSEFLEKENILCLFRAHPMSQKFDLPQSEYFQVTNDKWLNQKNLSLYQLLGITDLLVSDVSSVITDYLLIDRPIIHAMSDLEEYVATRPMLLNPPKDFFVGPLVKNQHELVEELLNLLNNPEVYSKKRKELKTLFFDNNIDNKSTERILNYLKLI